MPLCDPSQLDMLDKLLSFNPMTRMTTEQALAHPYMAEYYDPEDEPVTQKPFSFEVIFLVKQIVKLQSY